MVSPCRYTQSSNKRINVEGCKNTIGSEPINKEHKAVKQHSGPTIYLGKDNESKYSSLCRRWDSNIIWWDRVLMGQRTKC